jgi:hypothetical protein
MVAQPLSQEFASLVFIYPLKKIIIGYCIDTMKTQAQQKRYRYTNKERDDSGGLCYYSARYLAPWLARWIIGVVVFVTESLGFVI